MCGRNVVFKAITPKNTIITTIFFNIFKNYYLFFILFFFIDRLLPFFLDYDNFKIVKL